MLSRRALRLASGVVCLALYPISNAIACNTVAECAQEAVEAAHKAQTSVRIAVPSGAVMAFNLQECPQGWKNFSPLAGRAIVGAGQGNRDQGDKRLSERSLGDFGGVEAHTLTVQEMPSHTHEVSKGRADTGIVGTQNLPFKAHPPAWHTEPAGGNQPHNNMPPFYVLLYCERI